MLILTESGELALLAMMSGMKMEPDHRLMVILVHMQRLLRQRVAMRLWMNEQLKAVAK